MKEVKILQNQIGQFNLMNDEKSLSFIVGIVENGETVKRNGFHCVLTLEEHPEERQYYTDLFSEKRLPEMIEIAWKRADRLISTQNYKAETVAFASCLLENYDEISQEQKKNNQSSVINEIERLEKRLEFLKTREICGFEFDKNDLQKLLNIPLIQIEQKIAKQQQYVDEFKEGTEGRERAEKYLDTLIKQKVEIMNTIEVK